MSEGTDSPLIVEAAASGRYLRAAGWLWAKVHVHSSTPAVLPALGPAGVRRGHLRVLYGDLRSQLVLRGEPPQELLGAGVLHVLQGPLAVQ